MWHRVKKTRTEKTNRFDSRFHRKKYLHTWTKKCWWWTNSKSSINLVGCFCYAMHLKTATKKIIENFIFACGFVLICCSWTEKPNTEAHSFNFIPSRFECVYAYKSVCLCVRSLSVKIFQFVFHAQNTHTQLCGRARQTRFGLSTFIYLSQWQHSVPSLKYHCQTA